MAQRTNISEAVRRGLLFSSVAAVAFGTTGVVQAEEAGADVERIAITGSRIKRTDMETASPVQVIGADDIAKGSFTSVDEILQQSTASAGAATNAATNNGGEGVARVNLRGMGESRTLVLVNGRRMVVSGSGADASVDLNTIPVSMIERIEVLKDGASAVYGSDAVAGVVNIITKSDFEGVEATVNYGGSDKGDGQTFDGSIIMGNAWEDGNFVLGLSYSDRGEVFQTARDFSDCALTGPEESAYCYGSSYSDHGNFDYGNGRNAYDGGVEQDGYEQFDFVPYQYLYSPLQKFSVSAIANQEVSDDATFFMETLYTKRMSNQQLAPSVMALDVELEKIEASDPAMCANGQCPWTGVDIDDETPGVQEAEYGNYRRRMTEAGPREYEQVTDTVRISTGFNGYIDLGDGFDWEVAYTFGRNDAVAKTHNLVNEAKAEEAFYANPDEWFSGGDLSQETLDHIMYTDTSTGGNEMHVLNANLSGMAFEAPAGQSAFSVGMEYRDEKGWHQPDAVTVAGDSSQSQQDPTNGGYDTYSMYGELQIPLIADAPFAEEVTAELAVRWFDYSTFGSDSTYKAALTWRVDSDVMFRAVQSTSFRAPTVSELYGGKVGSFDYLNDPCSGVTDQNSRCFADDNFKSGFKQVDSQIENTWTTNEDLGPESADNFVFGVVLSPSSLDGVSMTVDYYKFKVEDAIARIDPQEYLDRCYNQGDERACETLNIERSVVDGSISYMESPLTNVGTQETSGIDANFNYIFAAAGLDWKVNVDVAHLLDFTQDGTDYTGSISGSAGGYAEWRSNYTLDVAGNNWSARYGINHIGEMTDTWTDNYGERGTKGVVYNDKIDAVWYHNISATYNMDTGSVTVGMDNIFDKEPPYMYSYSNANTAPEVYDVMGRYLYAKYSVRF